jgi:hypothetical protein
MADEAQLLLRMLEPAVRPAGTPARGGQPKPAVEDRTFDQLLSEAAAAQTDSQPTAATNVQPTTDAQPDLLEHLGRLGRVSQQTALSRSDNPNLSGA